MKHMRAMMGVVCLLMAVMIGTTACDKIPTDIDDRQDKTSTESGDSLPLPDPRDTVEAVFELDDMVPTDAALEQTQQAIEKRMADRGFTDHEVYVDPENNQVIARFSWESGDQDGVTGAVTELVMNAKLELRMGSQTTLQTDEDGNTVEVPIGELILTGADVESATASLHPDMMEPVVEIVLNESGTLAFANATATQAANGGTISIWLDGEMISNPMVGEAITNGEAMINGMDTMEEATSLANHLNAGMLPFDIQVVGWQWVK